MTKRALALAAVPLLLGTSGAVAEPLSRAEAVAQALKANPVIRRSNADYQALQGKAREARADALPEVTVNGSFLRFRDPSILNSSNFDQFPPEFKDFLTPQTQNLWDTNVAVRQTVFSFALSKAIRAAGYAKDLGSEDLRRARQDVSLNAILAYNGYLVAVERAKVAERVVGQKEKQLEITRSRRAAGAATELEVLRFDVDLQNARTELLRLTGAADLARGGLNAVLMRPIDTPVEATDSLEYSTMTAELEGTIKNAEANRPELKAAGWNEKIYDELIGIAKSDALPRVDLNGAYGWNTREAGNIADSDFRKWSVSVAVKVPVFDGWRTAGRVAQARANRARVGVDRAAFEEQIHLEAKQAVDRLRVAGSVLETAEAALGQAQKALDMTDANYRLGAANTLDVLNAQAAFAQAAINRVEALHAHANARAGLRYVMALDPLEGTPNIPVADAQGPTTSNETGPTR